MSSAYGEKIKISIFGQSHARGIGVVVDGLPAGLQISDEELSAFMARRAPGKSSISTARKEGDKYEFISGVVDGHTCGAPLCAVIFNTDTRSKDYSDIADHPRPSHADYPAQIRHRGFQDVRGGGHFSGRLTAPLCLAGGVCLQALRKKGIEIYARIHTMAGVPDVPIDPAAIDIPSWRSLAKKKLPVLDDARGEEMTLRAENARDSLDSVGGIIECVILGMPAGIGDPMFGGIENRISQAAFAIPAIKGIEFGAGFAAAGMTGSEHNDPFYYDDTGAVRTKTNNHGGILGGMSTGMPIIFRVAVKPTPSIAREQDTISFSKGENEKLTVHGRHDPCIVPRAVPCVEAAAAITIYDMLA